MTTLLLFLLILVVGIASQIKTGEAAFAVTMFLAIAVFQLALSIPGPSSAPQPARDAAVTWNEGGRLNEQ